MARAGKYAQPTVAEWDAKRAKVKAKARKALTKSAKDEDPTLEVGYSELTKDELVEELKARELPHTGNKEELIARLEEADVADPQDENE